MWALSAVNDRQLGFLWQSRCRLPSVISAVVTGRSGPGRCTAAFKGGGQAAGGAARRAQEAHRPGGHSAKGSAGHCTAQSSLAGAAACSMSYERSATRGNDSLQRCDMGTWRFPPDGGLLLGVRHASRRRKGSQAET